MKFTVNSRSLKEVVEALIPVAAEGSSSDPVVLVASPEGIVIPVLSKSTIASTFLELPADFFVSFDVPERVEMYINPVELAKVAKRSTGANEIVVVERDATKQRLKFQFAKKGARKRSFSIRFDAPPDDRGEGEEDESMGLMKDLAGIEMDVSMVVTPALLKEVFDDGEAVIGKKGDLCISAGPDPGAEDRPLVELVARGESVESESEIRMGDEGVVSVAFTRGPTSFRDLEVVLTYLREVTRAITVSKEVTIDVGLGYPVRLTYSLKNGGKVTSYVAPRDPNPDHDPGDGDID